MKLVVGLGNPGPRYDGSPHNVGFRVLDALAETEGASWQSRFRGLSTQLALGGEPVVLLKPQTFMNRSGDSVLAALSHYGVDAVDTVVVHDELDLPLGTLKLKRGGGEAGHNGLKSVSERLGTRDYLRLRVGVGRPAAEPVVDYLLTPMGERGEQLSSAVARAGDAIRRLAGEQESRVVAWLHAPEPAVAASANGPSRSGGAAGRPEAAEPAAAEARESAADEATKVEKNPPDTL